jgi:hypothetical protein
MSLEEFKVFKQSICPIDDLLRKIRFHQIVQWWSPTVHIL